MVENVFRFAATTVENGWNRLGKPQTMELCNTISCLLPPRWSKRARPVPIGSEVTWEVVALEETVTGEDCPSGYFTSPAAVANRRSPQNMHF